LNEPFRRVSMDLVSFSDNTSDNIKYILTLQDDLTKFVQAYPIPDKETLTVTKQILHFCQHFEVPKCFHSDQGTEFMNSVMKHLMRFPSSTHTFNTSIPPTDKRVSRRSAIRELETMKQKSKERYDQNIKKQCRLQSAQQSNVTNPISKYLRCKMGWPI
jgi:hypothetical protein